MDSYATYYENYPAVTAVTQAYDILRDNPELGKKVKSIFDSRREFLKQIIEDAQASGAIRKEEDSSLLADIFTSTFRGLCLKWRMNKFGFPLREQLLQALNMLLKAFGPCK